ncbi:MAG: type VI secretion system-associated protein TagF [Pseudaminobacter sp.]|nr:type VI secretion system-associated protein TagF [Pseudaminobacter sp.]
MGFGVYGKLPQKRDFIALNVPRGVLEPFEAWLQSAVAASRAELGAAWRDHYLIAPIWRFWIGADILGAVCTGSMVPSVDGVGRFFPLAILYCGEAGQEIAPPPFDPRDAWHEAIEERLLGVLDENAKIEVDRLTAGLDAPDGGAARPEPPPIAFKRGHVWRSGDGTASSLLAGLIEADYWTSASTRSFWWTNGGSDTGPQVYVRNALPDPFFYVDMIKGSSG